MPVFERAYLVWVRVRYAGACGIGGHAWQRTRAVQTWLGDAAYSRDAVQQVDDQLDRKMDPRIVADEAVAPRTLGTPQAQGAKHRHALGTRGMRRGTDS